jgi:hypothetical protein
MRSTGPITARPTNPLPGDVFYDENTGVTYSFYDGSWHTPPYAGQDISGFITATDYATSSKGGVVKIGDGLSISSGKVKVAAATASKAGGVLLVANQAASTAADVAGVVADLNTLLAALKAAGVMAADPEPEGD